MYPINNPYITIFLHTHTHTNTHTYTHTQGDKSNAGALVNTLNQAGQEVPQDLMKFGTAVKKKEHKLYGAFGPKGGVGENGEMKKATKIVFADDDE